MKNLLKRYERLIKYGIITIFITLVDIAVVRILSNIGTGLTTSNTVGVLTGSILQYILTIKYAFRKHHTKGTLLVHIGTFLLGLFVANMVINMSYEYLFHIFNESIRFYGSKLLSITSTFFLTYVLRLTLYKQCE